MRGIKVGFNEVASTISSKKKIHVVGLKFFIHIFEEKKLAIKGTPCKGLIKGSVI
jgi:hypothetical protein